MPIQNILDEVEAGASLTASSASRPPAQWSAAGSSRRYEEDQKQVVDRSAGGGGGGGPSLPFRIREVQIVPRAIGNQPVFSVSKPRIKAA
mmetsp:Transcript_35029/g.52719  ORF Transcript_35029/g.52719 Transcript_35029/m.52719 type:complete len:90 (+) Transcript_35029:107-376(+)